jgi:cytochrome c-type biogenesis protein CcmH/NrfF
MPLARPWAGLGICVVLVCSPTLAASRHPDNQPPAARALAHEVMSPFCPGRTLATCPSSAAADLRAEIAARIGSGETRDAVLGDLVARFGEGVLGVPRAAGVGLLAWTLPIAIAGLMLVAVMANASVARMPPLGGRDGGGGAADDDVIRRLQDELAALD